MSEQSEGHTYFIGVGLDGTIVAQEVELPEGADLEALEAQGIPKDPWTEGTIIGKFRIPPRPD